MRSAVPPPPPELDEIDLGEPDLEAPNLDEPNLDGDDFSDLLGNVPTRSTSPLDFNPYQSPEAQPRPPRVRRAGEIELTRITFGETMSTTWAIYRTNVPAFLGVTVLMIACIIVVFVGLQLVFTGIAFGLSNSGVTSPIIFYGLLAGYLAALVAATVFITLGMFNYMLHVARGKSAGVSLLFGSMPLALSGSAMALILLALVMISMLLFVVPVILVAIACSLAIPALVDRGEGAFAALKLSLQATMMNLLPIFLLFLASTAISLLGAVPILGPLFVSPFGILLLTVIYLHSTGQATIEDARRGDFD